MMHEDEMFRPYVPRGTGKYKTTVGRNTICKNCESLNNKAARYFKLEEKTDEHKRFLARVADAYKVLQGRGGTPVGPYARHVLGTEPVKNTTDDDDLLAAVLGDELQIHMSNLVQRSYESLDVAYDMQDRLKDRLKEANLYERADVLLEDWENDIE